MTICKFRLILATAITLSVTTGSVFAAETSTGALVLKKTYMKSEDASTSVAFFTATPAAAFSPTTVHCPISSATCVLHIDLSTQFNSLTPDDPSVPAVAVAFLTVDGSDENVLPNGVTGLDSTSTNGGSNARSFTWFTQGLPPGPHTVQVQFFVTGGSVSSATRTLTIGVYAPR